MSRRIINQILGLAVVDKEFAQKLLKESVAAVRSQGFQLTPEELRVFSTISASDLQEFSRILIQELHYWENLACFLARKHASQISRRC